jgi:ribosomal 50S subunit-associated protein YjgA (DUF615 family)
VNKDLEALILAYEDVSVARDEEAEKQMEIFESLIDRVLKDHPGASRDTLRKGVIRQHRKWALKQESKPPAIPPKA